MTSPVRLLIVSNQFAPLVGGAAKVPEELATAAPDRIGIATPGPANLPANYDQRFPFRVHRLPPLYRPFSRSIPGKLRAPFEIAYNRYVVQARTWHKLRQVIDAEQPNVLCLNGLGRTAWLSRYLRAHYPALRIVFYIHGEEVNDSPHLSRSEQRVYAALRSADASVSVSSFTRDRVLVHNVPPDRAWIVHNGVDTARFTPGPASPALIARWGLEGKRTLLCLARLDERKGQDMLIAAMPTILATAPDTVLLLVGDGNDRPRLERLIAQHNVTASVRLTGPATNDELVDYYRTADVYAMPNRTMPWGDTEGFGLVFLEAGACRKPVIGGNAGGVPDAVLDGKTGILVDGTSPADIAQAALQLLTNPELASSMAEAGLTHALSNRWIDQTTRLLNLCESLL